MSWLERAGGGPAHDSGSGGPEETSPERIRRRAPALAAVFEGLSQDPSRTVLDLGPASQEHLRLYRRYARRMRFANLLPHPPRGRSLRDALDALPPAPGRPYEVVLVWNLLDRLTPDQRRHLIARLAHLTAPAARLYVVVDASRGPTVQPVRITPLGPDRVAHEPAGEPEATGEPLLPAELKRLLEPFRIVRAFTLRRGLREYAATRKGESLTPPQPDSPERR